MKFTAQYLRETATLLEALNVDEIESMAEALAKLRKTGGRLFILGVGGSAAHASHAVNDFRKICHIEAYAPTDNVAELTARTNDDGWENTFVDWLMVSQLRALDAILILSVGGGNLLKSVSVNLVRAVELAQRTQTQVLAIVGRDGGFTRANADVSILILPLFKDRITPHTEGLCSVVCHLLVSHPLLMDTASPP